MRTTDPHQRPLLLDETASYRGFVDHLDCDGLLVAPPHSAADRPKATLPEDDLLLVVAFVDELPGKLLVDLPDLLIIKQAAKGPAPLPYLLHRAGHRRVELQGLQHLFAHVERVPQPGVLVRPDVLIRGPENVLIAAHAQSELNLRLDLHGRILLGTDRAQPEHDVGAAQDPCFPRSAEQVRADLENALHGLHRQEAEQAPSGDGGASGANSKNTPTYHLRQRIL
mmetsp:Transcript_135527/g.433540  ORF Transcript_135527/g.433540 Transcript_135527/m.433540 type:complete len:225 (+) Transcript_135527:787-1461(+)